MRVLKVTNGMVAMVALFVSSLWTAPASATLIVSDSFTYLDGTVVGQNGGSVEFGSWTTAWTDGGTTGGGVITDHLIVQTQALASIATPVPLSGSGRVNRSFSSTTTPGETLYAAYDLNMITNGEGGYQARLELLGGTVKLGVFDDLLRADLGTQTGTFDPGGGSDTGWTGQFRLVARVDFDKIGALEELTFWVNPASELDVPIATLQQDIGAVDLGSVVSFFKTGQEASLITFDNLELGTDFNFSPVPPVPEPSSLLLLGGVFTLVASRRRRRVRN